LKSRQSSNASAEAQFFTNTFQPLYVDLPSTAAKVFQYADDIAVTYQLNQFFHRWCLQPNPGKIEMCVFHLNTHAANVPTNNWM
jgi:CHAT domain-containing protein